MFPIGDERVQGGPPPVVTFALIALNVLAFFVELGAAVRGRAAVVHPGVGRRAAGIPAAHDLPPTIPLPFWSTLLTSMFLHGGWMHLGGNMLYLWIFGDNLEKVMGAARFLLFYLVCGLAASSRTSSSVAGSSVPAVGASGAISGVLGGYLLLFPRNRVRVLTRGGIAHVPAHRRARLLDRHPVHQRRSARWRRRARPARRGLHGAHRRVRRRAGAGQAVRGAEEARRGLTLSRAGRRSAASC